MNIQDKDRLLNFIDKFKDITIQSKRDNKEYGLRICSNDIMEISNVCIGEQCAVQLPECRPGKKRIGNFHTHPGGISFLSDDDIKNSIDNRERFSCIGYIGNREINIKCFQSPYSIKKELVENFLNSKSDFNTKIVQYNPSGTEEGLKLLSKEKINELQILYGEFLENNKKLDRESKTAALKLAEEKADFWIRIPLKRR